MEHNVNMSLVQHEIWKERTTSFCVEVKNGEVDALDTSIEEGLACRAIDDGYLGFAYSTASSIKEGDLVKEAVGLARFNHQDKGLLFPQKSGTSAFVPAASDIAKLSSDEKIGIAKRLEAAAMGYDKRIKGIRKAVYEDSIRQVEIRNTNGVNTGYTRSLCAARITVIASDGKNSEWDSEIGYAFSPKDLDVEKIAELAASRAIAYLDSRKISSATLPCIMDRHIVAEFLELFAPMFFADSVHKQRSALSGKINSAIHSKLLTIVNDATLPQGFSSTPCDAEGFPSQRTVLVQDGVLRSYLSDVYYAEKLKIPPTGSSVRTAINLMPKIGVQNIYIEPGKDDLATLMKKMGRGLYITDVLGLHTANPVTGDFSIGASGFMVENGAGSYCVKGVTIAGNINDILSNVKGIGSDLKFWFSKGAVSLLVENVAISG